MGLLTKLAGWIEHRASPENPSTSLGNPAQWLVQWLGGGLTDSGIAVNEVSAMQSAAVYSCIRIISETIAALPVHVMERTADGSTKVSSGLQHRLLTVEPNPTMSSATFREILTGHLAGWGNGYAELIRNGRGEVMEMWPRTPDRVEPRISKAGDLYYAVTDPDGSVRGVIAADMLHIPLFGHDGLKGYSPIQQSRNAIALSLASEKFGSSFYKNGAVPGTILTSEKPLSAVAVKNLVDSFNATHQGVGQNNKTMVLEGGVDIKTLGIPPADAQHLENRRFQLEEIARVFRVPLSFLQSSVGNTFASSEAQDLHFTKYCITPYVTRWEQELNRKVFSGQAGSRYFVKFNLNGLMRGVYKDRIDGLTRGIQSGLYTPNEARGLEDLPPISGGDSLFLQQNMAGVQAIADGTAGNAVKNAAGSDADPAPATENNDKSQEETP